MKVHIFSLCKNGNGDMPSLPVCAVDSYFILSAFAWIFSVSKSDPWTFSQRVSYICLYFTSQLPHLLNWSKTFYPAHFCSPSISEQFPWPIPSVSTVSHICFSSHIVAILIQALITLYWILIMLLYVFFLLPISALSSIFYIASERFFHNTYLRYCHFSHH